MSTPFQMLTNPAFAGITMKITELLDELQLLSYDYSTITEIATDADWTQLGTVVSVLSQLANTLENEGGELGTKYAKALQSATSTIGKLSLIFMYADDLNEK